MFSDYLFLMTMLTVNSVHEDLANLTSRFDEVRPQWYSCFCGWLSMVKLSGRKKKKWRFFKKKSLNGKSDKLKNLGLKPAKLFISDSMCHENHQLFYRCRQLKRQVHIRPGSSATASIIVFAKVGENSDATKIKHICDIEKALSMVDIDSYLGINVLISLVTCFESVICLTIV